MTKEKNEKPIPNYRSFLIRGVVSFARTTYRFITNHAGQIVTVLCAIQPAFVGAYSPNSKSNLALATYNQCPLVTYIPPFASQAIICRPSDEIALHYHIISNVPSIEDATRIVFAQRHQHFQEYRDAYSISVLGAPSDDVLFEGIDANAYFPCESLYLNRDGDLSNKPNDVLEIQNPPLFPNGQLFHCRGWEDYATQQKVSKKYAYYKEIETAKKMRVSIESQVESIVKDMKTIEKNASDIQANLKIYGKILSKMIAVYKEMYPGVEEHIAPLKNLEKNLVQLEKIGIRVLYSSQQQLNKLLSFIQEVPTQFRILLEKSNAFLKDIGDKATATADARISKVRDTHESSYQKEVVIARNRHGLIKTLKTLKERHGKIFIFSGAGHVVPEKATKKGGNLWAIDKTDAPYELRKFLADKPYAILVPKNNTRQTPPPPRNRR